MRRMLLALVGLLMLAAPARAMDLDGKWGVGLGVRGILETDSEISLIHGHSERTAYLIDLRIRESESHGHTTYIDPASTPYDVGNNTNEQSIYAGPRIRRFTRPKSDFSPYWDLYAHAFYDHDHYYQGSTTTQKQYGADTGFAFGAEYFTRWHFSVAAHSTVASFNWSHFTEDRVTPYGPAFSNSRSTRQSLSMGINPQVFIRAYF